jgi:MFS family permease
VRLSAISPRRLLAATSTCVPNSDAHRATAVQGLGAGAISTSVQIVISDLVTLRERGAFSGLMGMFVPVLRSMRRLLMDNEQLMGSRRRCRSSNWRVIGSERTLVCFISLAAVTASWFSPDRISFQEMAVLYVLLMFASSFQRVVTKHRPQPSNMRIQCDSCPALHASQDTTRNSK